MAWPTSSSPRCGPTPGVGGLGRAAAPCQVVPSAARATSMGTAGRLGLTGSRAPGARAPGALCARQHHTTCCGASCSSGGTPGFCVQGCAWDGLTSCGNSSHTAHRVPPPSARLVARCSASIWHPSHTRAGRGLLTRSGASSSSDRVPAPPEEGFGWSGKPAAAPGPEESVSESAFISEDQAALLSSSQSTGSGGTSTSASRGEDGGGDPLEDALASLTQGLSGGGGRPTASATGIGTGLSSSGGALEGAGFLFDEKEAEDIRDSWESIMRWSRVFREKTSTKGPDALATTKKVVVMGAGSFGTSMASVLASNKKDLDVVVLLRDPYLAMDINTQNCNTKYLPDFKLPKNLRATTSAEEAIKGAQYAIHAVPVQHSRKFLSTIRDLLPEDVPIISVSKGLEVGTGLMMSELIPSALGRKQPTAFVSGPSFAREVMEHNPTGVVAASKKRRLAQEVQQLFANPQMRVNTTTDVIGVEICGALKNVLAIAAGITEGLDLGHNALAALVAQGCAEIRWLAEKMGAKPATLSGLSGLGDIMLTCYVNLSRNRTVGVRLGRGESLADILASSSQVAEGVSTAGVVATLARKYHVHLPVLTAVATILNGEMSPRQAVEEIMNLPQIEEH